MQTIKKGKVLAVLAEGCLLHNTRSTDWTTTQFSVMLKSSSYLVERENEMSLTCWGSAPTCRWDLIMGWNSLQKSWTIDLKIHVAIIFDYKKVVWYVKSGGEHLMHTGSTFPCYRQISSIQEENTMTPVLVLVLAAEHHEHVQYLVRRVRKQRCRGLTQLCFDSRQRRTCLDVHLWKCIYWVTWPDQTP